VRGAEPTAEHDPADRSSLFFLERSGNPFGTMAEPLVLRKRRPIGEELTQPAELGEPQRRETRLQRQTHARRG